MDNLTEIEGHGLLEVTSFPGLTLTNKLNFSKFKRERQVPSNDKYMRGQGQRRGLWLIFRENETVLGVGRRGPRTQLLKYIKLESLFLLNPHPAAVELCTIREWAHELSQGVIKTKHTTLSKEYKIILLNSNLQ